MTQPKEPWECGTCHKKVPKNRKFCSKSCYSESMKGIKGKKASNWKPKVGKSQVHNWLNVNYGKPKSCENPKCLGKSKTFDWAKKTSRKYLRKRENFLRLCRSCHRKYDLTALKKKKAIKNLWWNTGIKNPGTPHPENMWFYKDKEKTAAFLKKRLLSKMGEEQK